MDYYCEIIIQLLFVRKLSDNIESLQEDVLSRFGNIPIYNKIYQNVKH